MTVTWSARPAEPAGHTTTGGEWTTILDEIDLRGIVARANRPTNSTGTTTSEIGVVRLDNVAIKANRLYVVRTNGLDMFSTVAGDTIKVNIRYSTSGVATTSSTLLVSDYERAHVAGGAGGGTMTIYEDLPVQGSDTTMSILLSFLRNTGTGTCTLLANIKMFVEAHGSDPGDTGVDL